MKKLVILALALPLCLVMNAQLLSWSPAFPADTSPTVTITADASKGNQGLLNYSPVTDVYVHIGAITSLSTNPSDWKYVKYTWGTADPGAHCTSTGSNKWQYTITGGLRNFFGITNPSERILRIAILFRTGDGSKKLANADGSDMYVPVFDNSVIAVQFTLPLLQPLYNAAPEPATYTAGSTLNVAAAANRVSDMKLYLDGTVVQTALAGTSIAASPLLATAGSHTVVAEANDNGTLARDTLQLFVNNAVTIAPLPAGVRDGLNYEASDSAVTLVLFAPSKTRVSVIGDIPGSNWTEQPQYQMNKTPDGNYWWLRLSGLTPHTEYAFQYLVDGTLKIADPYVEKILDPFNDSGIPPTVYPGLKPYPVGASGIVGVLQTAATSYNWHNAAFVRPDHRKLMIYELLARDFVAAHNWSQLRDTLSYLQRLGINAVELMPLNEFEGNNSWGYNPDFYFAPDKYYGPSNTLKEFIDSCHSRGMAVIMDIALNHSFGSSPMVQLYWDGGNNRPAADNPWFNPVPKHAFNVGYDMNHESVATKYFVSRVTRHWLENYRIDGFRFDLSKGFTQTATCDNNGNNCNVSAWGAYDSSRVRIWKRYYDSLQVQSPGSYAILEHFANNSEEIDLSNYGMMLWGNMSYNYEQASMGYPTGWDLSGGIFTSRGWSQPNLVTYMESHDEERIVYKNVQFGNASGSYNVKDLNTALKRAEMCAAFLFPIPGPKMFWQFGELGYDYSINTCVSGSVNDSCRLTPKPIRWDYLQNVQRQRLHDVYAALINLRFSGPYKDVFATSQVTWNVSNSVKWIQVGMDSSKLLVIGNFDVIPVSGVVTFPEPGTWYDYLSGGMFTATGTSQTLPLQPGEYHVYLNRNLVANITTPVTSINNPANGWQVSVYPNPVQAVTRIQYNVPQAGRIRIEILGINGSRGKTIYEGAASAGVHSLELTKHEGLPAGSYVVRLTGGRGSALAKMIIL